MQGEATKTLNTGELKSTLQITHFTTGEAAFISPQTAAI